LRSTTLQSTLPEIDFIGIAQRVVCQFLDLDFH
jgi:hypothetical protein